MFILDSLMINGISWALRTAVTAAEAEMNDDTALREQLLAAEMQREMGEISDEDFVEIERDLLARIREIKQRREGGSGPLAFGEGEPIETGEDGRFQIEASVSGDFHDPADAPHTTIVEEAPPRRGLIGMKHGQTEQVLDIEPTRAETLEESALPLPTGKRRAKGIALPPPTGKRRAKGSVRAARAGRTRSTRATRTARTTRPSRATSRRTKIR
ncbi:MAG TPA: gas vesicle protein GvpG [Vicinamibacterales bacterium]|nr:gas vesicle protein GvpG [Vicinamibacterales bacterium]